VVVHVVIDEHDGAGPARVGFVVSRAVGPAVVRNRTKRRLRALMADRLKQLPAGSLVVVRALGGAGNAESAVLATDLGVALARVLRPSDRPVRRGELTGGDAGRPR
jgi:ribonuclease P protein component